MSAGDLLQRIRDEIRARVDELAGAAGEAERLRGALEALDGRPAPAPRPGAGAGSRRRVPRAERLRALVDVVAREPGIRPAAAARAIDLQPSAVYGLVAEAVDAGQLRKADDGGLQPAAARP